MPIFFRPVGGLGNQLFTYAAGRALADSHRQTLVADLSNLEQDTKRKFELSDFASRIDAFVSLPPQEVGTLGPKDLPVREVRERGASFDPQISNAEDGTLILGYLQSWKYFHTIRSSLREEIREIAEPSLWFLEKRKELSAGPPWAAITVRRGDYLTTPGMGIVGNHYYNRAIDLLKNLHGQQRFLVFSDSPDEAKKVPALANLPESCFVEPPISASSAEVMVLQSLASHMILSNSTFAWWSGWLGDREDRTVIFPYPWGNFDSVNDRDRQLPNWIGVGRDSVDEALHTPALFRE